MKSINKTYETAILECYQQMYEQATPKADFKQLLEDATEGSHGKEIPFNDYVLDRDIQERIVRDVAKKYKFTGSETSRLSVSVMLGVSPRFTAK